MKRDKPSKRSGSKRPKKKRGLTEAQLKKRAKDLKANRPLEATLLDRLGVDPGDWDYLIVSDGSGTTIGLPCGWGGILIDKHPPFGRKCFYGGMSNGTNIVAEMMGVIQPLMWLTRQKDRRKPARIHVITDCEVVKNGGNDKGLKKANRELWFFLDALTRRLGTVKFHWLPRESTMLNRLADRVAGASRKRMLEAPDVGAIPKLPVQGAESLHDLNPD